MTFWSCFYGFGDKPYFGSNYVAVRLLGKGAAGQVWLCRSRKDKTKLVALKCTSTKAAAWQLQMALRECSTLCRLGWSHVGILHPLQLIVTAQHISLTSYYAAGGNMTDYCKRHRPSENEACYFFRQLINVIEHMHAGHVAYRDVKLDNMLLTDSAPPRLVLCDFGTSKDWEGSERGSQMHTFLGTPGQQTLLGQCRHSCSVDVYASARARE